MVLSGCVWLRVFASGFRWFRVNASGCEWLRVVRMVVNVFLASRQSQYNLFFVYYLICDVLFYVLFG